MCVLVPCECCRTIVRHGGWQLGMLWVTGAVTLPYAWQPAIVEISILRVGQV